MKLWIDDIRNAPDDTWTVARTVTSAIKAIEMFGKDIKVISFDHDISYQIELNGVSRPYPSPETFQAVALFAALYWKTTLYRDRPLVKIHTANPAGCKELERILELFEVEVKMMGIANRLEQEV